MGKWKEKYELEHYRPNDSVRKPSTDLKYPDICLYCLKRVLPDHEYKVLRKPSKRGQLIFIHTECIGRNFGLEEDGEITGPILVEVDQKL